MGLISHLLWRLKQFCEKKTICICFLELDYKNIVPSWTDKFLHFWVSFFIWVINHRCGVWHDKDTWTPQNTHKFNFLASGKKCYPLSVSSLQIYLLHFMDTALQQPCDRSSICLVCLQRPNNIVLSLVRKKIVFLSFIIERRLTYINIYCIS